MLNEITTTPFAGAVMVTLVIGVGLIVASIKRMLEELTVVTPGGP